MHENERPIGTAESSFQSWVVYLNPEGRYTYLPLGEQLDSERTMNELIQTGHQIIGIMPTSDLYRLISKQL